MDGGAASVQTRRGNDVFLEDFQIIDHMEELVTLVVRTQNTVYEISILKRRGIYVGMRMEIVRDPVEMISETVQDPVTRQKEFLHGYKAVVTSPVEFIGVI
jgi:hypothetical protein